jgi:hypothetical protein
VYLSFVQGWQEKRAWCDGGNFTQPCTQVLSLQMGMTALHLLAGGFTGFECEAGEGSRCHAAHTRSICVTLCRAGAFDDKKGCNLLSRWPISVPWFDVTAAFCPHDHCLRWIPVGRFSSVLLLSQMLSAGMFMTSKSCPLAQLMLAPFLF